MKNAGTIKLEIIKPLDISWKALDKRMTAMSRALAPALNLTLREFYSQAMGELESRWKGEIADTQWRNQIKGVLRIRWNSELARLLDNDRRWALKNEREEPDAASYLPVGDVWSGETADLILSRFTGDHLRGLLASEASFPTFTGNKPYYSEGRKCVVEGKVDRAILRVPLWGTGTKLTALAVAPCGGNAKALWRKLVHDFGRRAEVVEVERAIKAARAEKARLSKELALLDGPSAVLEQSIEAAKTETVCLTTQLEELSLTKLGRVGVKYDDKRGKWYALISWSQSRPDNYKTGLSAAVNLGVNVFLQALDEEGFAWDCAGTDVRVTRERFAARRRSIQKGLKFCGRGARGHGQKRFVQPLTKLNHREQNWMQNKNRTIAAELVKWCLFHKVSDLYLEDLTGIRESFEKHTKGEADTRVKRAIHSWPFYQLGQAIERQCSEMHIEVHKVSSADCSQRCPKCGHQAQENVVIVDRGGDYLLHPEPDRRDPESTKRARVYKSVDKGTRFLCVACGHKGKGDIVTCANMLVNAGKKSPLGKAQEKARKRTKAKIKTKKGDKK